MNALGLSIIAKLGCICSRETLDTSTGKTDIWSLGCLLYAMCYFKSPYDIVYERGDSVALAVLSGTVSFPEGSPYPENIHNLILFMLKIDYNERPYIHAVIEKLDDVINQVENKV
ncbi:serine/threonine-protein kinase 16 [Agrilus planipennis]|uniref:Serine/threonine-protein kinase 16 n=1 Tax=Agrilus planipennis TaxID=224129 RepID=A0A7F5R076_AGRPL|nr:serine/threonine-protein kinase 16 [Agrilus planipennis]